MKPIFPKGTKVVKGQVVQRLQGSSQVKKQKLKYLKDAEDEVIMDAGGDAGMRAHYTGTNDPDFLKAVMRLIQQGRTGPRLASNQFPKTKTSLGQKLGDPRQFQEYRKNKPGRIDQNTSTRQMEGYDLEGEPGRMMDLGVRSQYPEVEGRGASPLSKIIDAMRGKKMPAPLLEQLKGLDPVKLEKILALINKSKINTSSNKKYPRKKLSLDRPPTQKELEDSYNSPDDLPF